MNISTCHSPLTWDTLLTYWLGELDPDIASHTEEHYLGCAVCSHRLEQLTSLAHAVRALTLRSGVSVIINEQFVRKLSESGRTVREYRVPLNGSVNCTVSPADDFVVARLEAPLDGVARLDMVTFINNDQIAMRQEDIPFIAESGGVVFVTNITELRALPASTVRVRLLAIDNNGERTLGEYRFNHTPYTPQRPV